MPNVGLTLDLINKVSNNASQIAKDLMKIDAAAKQVQKQLGITGLDKKMKSAYVNSMFKDMKRDWSASAIAAGEIIKDAFEAAAKSIYNGVVKAMEYVGQSEQTQIGLKYQAPFQRNYINKDVAAYGDITGTGNEQIKQQMLPLLRALHGRADADNIARQIREASSDLSVMLGHGTNDTGEFVDVFSRIINREGLQARQLQRLGINEKDFFEMLGKNLGLTEEAAKGAAKKGENADAVRNTLLQYVATTNKNATGQYKTGVATKEYSESLNGRVDRLKALPEDLLASLQGTDALKKINDQLGHLYDLVIKNKDVIAGTFLKVVTKLGDFLERAFQPETIDKFVGYLTTAGTVLGFIFDHANGIYSIFQAIGVVILGLKAIGWIEGLAAALPGIGTALGTVASVLGAGVLPVILAVAAAVGSVVYAIIKISETVKELGGALRVWQDFKDWIGGDNDSGVAKGNKGFAAQQEQNERNLALAHGGFVADIQPRQLQHATPNSSQINLSPTFNYSVDGNTSNEDLNHTLQEHSQQVNDQMQRLLEQTLTEGGGAPASRSANGFPLGRSRKKTS